MAHPGYHQASESLARELVAAGVLDGIECYYGDHSPTQVARFVDLCRELDLVPTGGSDFHGPGVNANVLGKPAVPWSSYQALCRRAGRL
jgi:predicted metal-dependent phosphoesterase TrpH